MIKECWIGLAVNERVAKACPVTWLCVRCTARKALADGARPVERLFGLRAGRKAERFGGIVGYKIARYALGAEVVIGQKLCVGDRDRDALDAQMLCQFARRGELLTLTQTAREDTLCDHLLSLGLQRALRVRIKKEGFYRNGNAGQLRLD